MTSDAAIRILEQWARYTDFDPNRKKFNLLTSEYEVHRCNERIVELNEQFDNSGVLAVIYAKNTFLRTLKEAKIGVYPIVANRKLLDSTYAMWDAFHSPEVLELEASYITATNRIIEQLSGRQMLGNADNEAVRNVLFESIDAVVEELKNCNEDLFLRGGEIRTLNHIDSKIHVFHTLAECLLALESSAKDGIYLGYIDNYGSADGHFSFFIKSNGNLLSVNERINEAYAGSHSHSRNGRWSESKQYRLFPYDHIFSYEDHDYKGYAKKHIIDTEKLNLFSLGEGAYLPIVFAILMLKNKYEGESLDLPVKYVDSLVQVNLLGDASDKALTIYKGSQLVANHKNISISFTKESVLSGEASMRFNRGNRTDAKRSETGVFTKTNQILVDLYGGGFEFNPDTLLETNTHLKKLQGDTGETPTPEFIGTQGRLELQAYYTVRKQLAEHIRDAMHREYIQFGGIRRIREWYSDSLNNSVETIYRMCAKAFGKKEEQRMCTILIAAGEVTTVDASEGIPVEYSEGRPESVWPEIYMNGEKDGIWGKHICPVTGAIASQYFTFRPRDWREIEEILGSEVPKIVKGWKRIRHGAGNHILEVTDMVAFIGTPFETYERNQNKRYEEQERLGDGQYTTSRYDFSFSIGFSKRGLTKILKEYSPERENAVQ